jgi:hypothetical protein
MTGSLLSEGLVEADESDRAIGWGCSEAVGWSSVSSAMTVYISIQVCFGPMIESVNRKCRHLSHRLTRLLPHPQSRENGTGDPIEARQLRRDSKEQISVRKIGGGIAWTLSSRRERAGERGRGRVPMVPRGSRVSIS